MGSLELYDSYETYYAGRESSVSTRHREDLGSSRDQQKDDEDTSGEASPAVVDRSA